MDLKKVKPSKNLEDRMPKTWLLAVIDGIQQVTKTGKYDEQLQYDIEEKRRLIENSIGEPFMNDFIEGKREPQNVDPKTGLYDIKSEVDLILADLFKKPGAKPLWK